MRAIVQEFGAEDQPGGAGRFRGSVVSMWNAKFR
jgi:hypothetical protein